GKAPVMRRSGLGKRLRGSCGGAGGLLLSCVRGEDEPEFGALARGTIEFEAAADGVGGAAGECESEAGAAAGAVAGFVDAVEAVEDAALVFRGDADAAVFDGEDTLA